MNRITEPITEFLLSLLDKFSLLLRYFKFKKAGVESCEIDLI